MNKTAMQILKAKTEKAIIYATPDEANLLRGVLVEIESLLPAERQQIEDAHRAGKESEQVWQETYDQSPEYYYTQTYKTS